MLINATRPAEVRAAILDDGKLDQLEIEVRNANLLKGNIYKGRVANVEGSLGACFVEFGADKQGFLPLDEISPSCYHRKWDKKDKPRITDVMQRGREVLVQVVKDAVGNKGAALTTRISLAGRYIVLMPLDDSRGVSRKVSSDAQRKKIKDLASKLKIPQDYGFIVRTAGLDRTRTDLNRDAAQLVRTWKNVLATDKKSKAPALLHEDRDLVVRMLRDYYDNKIERILIDDEEAVGKAEAYFRRVMPRSKKALHPYTHKVPMFARYRVEEQIEEIFSRRAGLKSGGYILIDPTEALISIDVNSGRSTRQKSQEETALHTNLEAAREVARQLRLRDLGGLIVIDFIDLPTRKANRQVEKALKDALKDDKARTYVGKISDNGLLEVNRQRLKQALQSQTHRTCPTCEGRGVIPGTDFVARKLLRTLEAKAAGGNYAKVIVKLHPELADHVQNTHRRDLVELEERFGLLLALEGRPGLHRGEQDIRWFNLDKISEAERRLVDDRRKAMVEANKSLARRRAEAEAAARALEAEEAELQEIEDGFDEDTVEIEAEPASTPDLEEEQEDGEPSRAGRRSRRGRGRNRARGRGRAHARTDSADPAPADPADEPEEEAKPQKPTRSRRDRDKRGRDRGERRSREAKKEPEEKPAEVAEAADELDADSEARLSRSQKRRLRRKRKRARERDEGDGEGQPEAGTGDGAPADEAPAPEPADAPAPTPPREPPAPVEEPAEVRPDVEPEAETVVDPMQAPLAEEPPPGESLAPPASDGVFGSLKRYLGLGSRSTAGSSGESGS